MTVKAKILAVDDEPDLLTTLKRGLEMHGYDVDAFGRAADAIKLDTRKYDMAILDIRMPDINGFQLARQLWQQNEKLPICFLTAFEIYESEAKKVMPDLRTYCFIKKPILPSELAKHIENHLAKH
jgi:two-component system, OmpR family, response regulator ChvI